MKITQIMNRTYLITLIFLPVLDLLYEVGYQIYFKTSGFKHQIFANTEMSKYVNYDDAIQHIEHSSVHSIWHHINHIILVFISMFFVLLLILPAVCRGLKKRTLRMQMFYPKLYQGLTAYEVLLLHLQTTLIRYMETKTVMKNILVNALNIPKDVPIPYFSKLTMPLASNLTLLLIFFAVAPLEMAIKVYMERKLHHNSSYFTAFLFSIEGLLYLSLQAVFQQVSKINDIDGPTKVSIYGCNEIIPFTMALNLGDSKLLVASDPETINKFPGYFQFLCFRFTPLGACQTALEVVRYFLFAGVVVYFDKNYLKSFLNRDIGAICGHFFFEEFINLELIKYLNSPLNILINHLTYVADDLVEDKISLIEYLITHCHEYHSVSLFYGAFNGISDKLYRVSRLLDGIKKNE